MTDIIRVLPAHDMRVEFAKWGSHYGRRVYTCSHAEFAVPADLFTETPEELLVGSIVDGHPYRSPLEDAAAGVAPPGTEPAPEATPTDEEGPGAEPAPAADGDETSVWRCPSCDRTFATQRGMNKHRSAAHGEEN